MEEKLTEQEVNEKIEKAKADIRSRQYKSIRVLSGLHSTQQLLEYKNKKQKNRIRSKMQKLNRKKNRSK